jgi:hypothetical protein
LSFRGAPSATKDLLLARQEKKRRRNSRQEAGNHHDAKTLPLNPVTSCRS